GPPGGGAAAGASRGRAAATTAILPPERADGNASQPVGGRGSGGSDTGPSLSAGLSHAGGGAASRRAARIESRRFSSASGFSGTSGWESAYAITRSIWPGRSPLASSTRRAASARWKDSSQFVIREPGGKGRLSV